MSLYEKHVLPHVINCACGAPAVERQRQKVVPQAKGRVLELGIGTGLNARHYQAGQVTEVLGVDPSRESWVLAQPKIADASVPIEYCQASAEDIPLDNNSIDTVVITYTLCTIPDPASALSEVARVLRPGGLALIAEHALAPDPSIVRWQNRLNGLWGKIAGGCHINRDIRALLDYSLLSVDDWQGMYLPQTPKVAGYNVWGTAYLESR